MLYGELVFVSQSLDAAMVSFFPGLNRTDCYHTEVLKLMSLLEVGQRYTNGQWADAQNFIRACPSVPTFIVD